jgi:hypothetical protein
MHNGLHDYKIAEIVPQRFPTRGVAYGLPATRH